MLRYCAWVLAVLLIVASSTTGNSLDSVKEKFESITSFSASFSQITVPAVGDTQHFEGSLVLLRPTSIRMEISSPEEQLIIFNGEQAWLYLPEKNTCYIYASSSIGALVQIPEYIFDPFAKLIVDTVYHKSSKELFIAFTAPDEDPFIRTIALTVSTSSLLPQELRIMDKAGTTTAYLFSAIKANEATNGSFSFTPPESTEIIEQ